jgi:hypothetical protein
VRNARALRPATAAVVIAALFGLGACTSTPSAKAVAQDFVESIEGLTTAERQCMLGKLDTYSDDQLEAIGDENVDVDFDQPDAVQNASEDFQAFVDDLAECRAGSG